MQFRAVTGILLQRVLPIGVGLGVLVLVIAWLAGVMEAKIEPARSPVAVRRIDPGGDYGIDAVREVTKQYIEEAVGTLKSAKRTEISARVLAPIDRILANAGLAWAIIFGIFASTIFTLLVIPVVYWMLYGGKGDNG